MPPTQQQQQSRPQGVADPQEVDDVEDDDLILPDVLMDLLESIDFSPGATNPQTLVNALVQFAPQLGVVFKKG